ncbi:MAG: hypothetical protein JNL98_40715 [Bryobacterales bacterium]|nr:hypothetical protein [Bryobacterales bacterium]
MDNPHLVATQVAVAVDDERNNRLASKAIAEAAPRTSFFYRVNPGRHKLRIGTKQEWIVQLDVNAKKN